MPKEIEKSPDNFYQKIVCVRMELDQLYSLLEHVGVNKDTLYGVSKNAEFEGLEDIKTSPARFSGEPFLRVTKEIDGVQAHAAIEFKQGKTVVSGGRYGRVGIYVKENNALAKLVYEELKPYSNKFEAWADWIALILTFLSFAVVFSIVGEMFANFSETGRLAVPDRMEEVSAWSFGIFVVSSLFYWFFETRQPIAYSPSKTFLQQHGGSVASAIVSGMFVGLVLWFLKAYFG